MANVVTETAYGYVVSCTGGTGVPAALLVPKGGDQSSSIKIVGIACGGAATTDITTVNDGQGNSLFKGSAIVNTMATLALGGAINVRGLQVGFAGATTGYCIIYITN